MLSSVLLSKPPENTRKPYVKPAIFTFKVTNKNAKKRCEICSKLKIITLNMFYTFFVVVYIIKYKQVNVYWAQFICVTICSD